MSHVFFGCMCLDTNLRTHPLTHLACGGIACSSSAAAQYIGGSTVHSLMYLLHFALLYSGEYTALSMFKNNHQQKKHPRKKQTNSTPQPDRPFVTLLYL